jgi:hypothetical protein
MADLFPIPSEDHLRSIYVGKSLDDIPTPAAIIDRAKAHKNCQLLLDAVSQKRCSQLQHARYLMPTVAKTGGREFPSSCENTQNGAIDTSPSWKRLQGCQARCVHTYGGGATAANFT